MKPKLIQSCMGCWQPDYKFDANWTHLPFICDKCRATFTPIQMADLYERWRTRRSVEDLTQTIRDLLKQARESAQNPIDELLDADDWWKRGEKPE